MSAQQLKTLSFVDFFVQWANRVTGDFMKCFSKVIAFSTCLENEFVDLTAEVLDAVEKSGVKNGLCTVFSPHATGMIVLNENEGDLKSDIFDAIESVAPKKSSYRHHCGRDNASSHILSCFVGTDKTIPVIDSELVLGTWQNVFFVETDGPRSHRKLIVQIVGE